MNQAVFRFDAPKNEEALSYGSGTPERKALEAELIRQSAHEVEIPLVIGGKEIRTGRIGKVVMPHEHGHVLATYHKAGPEETRLAIEAALKAKKAWAEMSWVDRTSIMMKAAELISKKHRFLLNAATMLGQSKNAYQAKIDAACEGADFLRFYSYYASGIYAEQPFSGNDAINRLEYRPLEGFVFCVSPFNFTAIPINLTMAVAVMGNTTVWKPATTSLLSNWYVMQILREAGLPDGVVNFLPGPGREIGQEIFAHTDLAGVHFTGATETFNSFWRMVSDNLSRYRGYPKMVGETGGKDFIFAHASADAEELATAILRGSFEYQGQKCSAASRAYVPKSLWPQVRDRLVAWTEELAMGDVREFGNFINAVIDETSFDNIMGYIDHARSAPDVKILAGGVGDKSRGYFVRPTLLETSNPDYRTMHEEIFGPVMTVFVYEDNAFEETLRKCDATSPYALTGAIFARDRQAVLTAHRTLRYAAGNFYINDKPTGAQIGLQPFGGARASGTNDKAGSHLNLMPWVSPRTIKENLLPPRHYRYPFMD